MPGTIAWPTVVDHPRQLERIEWHPSAQRQPDVTQWPFTIPAVAQLIEAGGLEIPPGVTFLVGENGSGKSTLVEALAAIYSRRGFETPFADKLGPGQSGEDSPLRCLALIALLDEMRGEGSQVIVATHSPLLVALPGAALLELGEWGIRPAAYDELDVVQSWRAFLDGPEAYLRHLLE
jgi:predicted ATPase